MMFLRTFNPVFKFCRSRAGTYLISGFTILVIFIICSHTLLTIHLDTSGSLSPKDVYFLHSKAHQIPYYAESQETNSSFPKKKILIVGYMRSGSTLCGDILQTHPRVFYVYEPLLYLWDHYTPGRKIHEKDVRKRAKKEFLRFDYVAHPTDYLQYMFNCNLTSFNLKFLTNVRHSRDFRKKECKANKKRFYGVIEPKIEICAQILRSRCQRSETILQKTVRYSMEEVESFMETDPDLKVIHLIRDPRGSLLSRIHFTEKVTGEMHRNVTILCQRLANDLIISQRLSSKYWGRILTVRYEDLAESTTAVSAMMYRFADLEFLPSVKAYLRIITNTETLDANGRPQKKSTARRDPFKTAYNWRQELPFSVVQEADSVCETVYKHIGYVKFSSETDLVNMSIPAKTFEYGEGLMTMY